MRTDKALAYIDEGQLDNEFLNLYGARCDMVSQRQRYANAVRAFEECFGPQEVAIFSAPGRTEIGGNHTDHQRGEVLAAAIHLDTIAIAAKSNDKTVEILSDGFGKSCFEVDDLSRKDEEKGTSIALVKGVLAGLKEHGKCIGGFKAYITSAIPAGAGLSSSAAYETLIGTIISGLYNEMEIDRIEIAKIGQYAENVYFGKPCGLMDQMACSVGNMVHINFATPEKPVFERIECDIEKQGYSLCITDTKGSHADLTDDYAAVPQEMKAVAECFGKKVLIEVTQDALIANMAEVRAKCGDRAVLRALHFFEENNRVQKEAEALRNGQIKTFLKNIKASGDSSYKYLQNVYTNHDVTHQNVSLALALSDLFLKEKGVSRVHGGGFAGTIQAFVETEIVEDYRKYMNCLFGENACTLIRIRKYGGRKVIE